MKKRILRRKPIAKPSLKKLTVFLFGLFIAVFVSGIFVLSLRGMWGIPNSTEMNADYWKDNGPLELSPERGRFALMYSLIEDGSMRFSLPIARFATPDLGYHDGNYVSLFAPGLSYLIIPGYLMGKTYGFSQVGAYAIVAIFALVNGFFIIKIAKLLGASTIAGTLAAFTFLFASPAFAYAVSLYQHHVSTFLILAATYMVLRFKSAWALLPVWFLCAAAIPIDYPNLFLMFPIGIAALGHIVSFESLKEKMTVSLKPFALITVISALLPLGFFLWFNQQSYGNPLQFSGTVEAVKEIDKDGNPVDYNKVDESDQFAQAQSPHELEEKTATGFFDTRNMLNGAYTHFISPDRGMLYFTPVLFLSIVGMFVLYRRNQKATHLFLAIIGTCVVLYSMWGDPWGGWAFGSRYMIPAYAIAAIFVAIALEQFRKKSLFLLLFAILFAYSVAVNSIGALSTSRIPPKVQVLALEALSGREEKYNYWRGYDMLANGTSKSFVYQTYLQERLTALEYLYLIAGSIGVVSAVLLITFRLTTSKTVKTS